MAKARQVRLQPRQLVVAYVAHGVHLYTIVQPYKVNALMVVTVPAVTYGSLAETLLVLRTIVDKVVLAGYVEYLTDLTASDHLRGCIELHSLRVLRDVAG